MFIEFFCRKVISVILDVLVNEIVSDDGVDIVVSIGILVISVFWVNLNDVCLLINNIEVLSGIWLCLKV